MERPRLGSVDAFRGLAMALMMLEALDLAEVARSFPGSPTWRWLAFHQSHVEWSGCSLHDLIQPAFTFLVGTSLALAGAGGGPWSVRRLGRAAWRSAVLMALGIGLRSVGQTSTNFTFEDTLTQIGLGYFPLVLIARLGGRGRWIALMAILATTWLAFASYPAPGPGFDFDRIGVPIDWPHHVWGFGAHWNKNANLGWRFDRWWLNLFPRESRFEANPGGYATLSAVPTLATMVLGLIAGSALIGPPSGPRRTIARLVGAGALGIALGVGLDRFGVCPIVKRIWTPAWVLFSGGICSIALSAWHAVVDTLGWRRWAYPLMALGRNSITAYCLSHLVADFVASTWRTHLGPGVFRLAGEPWEPIAEGAAVVATLWAILIWMDRRRIYLRV